MKKHRQFKVFWYSLGLFLLIFGVGMSILTGSVDASTLNSLSKNVSGVSQEDPFILPKDITNSGTEVPIVRPGKEVYVDDSYSFIPRTNSNTTVRSSTKHSWYTQTYPNGAAYYQLNLSNYNPANSSESDRPWVMYQNIGTYDGQAVDLVMRVNGIKLRNVDYVKEGYRWDQWYDTISFSKSDIAFQSSGFEWVDISFEFYKHQPYDQYKWQRTNVSGYMTIGDLDSGQGVQFDKTTTNLMDTFILGSESNSGSEINYSYSNGQVKVENTNAYSLIDNDSKDPRHRFTFLYQPTNRIGMRWIGGKYAPNATYVYPVEDYFFYEIEKPVPTELSTPVKTGTLDENGVGNFTIKHSTPVESPEFYYKSFWFEDKIVRGMRYPRIQKITNSAGKDVTSWFDLDNNRYYYARATAKASTLKNPAFYGETFTMQVTTEIDVDGINKYMSGMSDPSTYRIQNTAKSGNNGFTRESKPVDPITPTDPNDPTDPIAIYKFVNVRHINADNGEVLEEKFKIHLSSATVTEEAIYDGKSYGVGGKLQLSDIKVNNVSKGKASKTYKDTGTSNVNIDFYYKSPFTINIKHVDEDTGETITTEKITTPLFKGDSYKGTPVLPDPYKNFTQNNKQYPYSPTTPVKDYPIDFQDIDKKDYNYHITYNYTKPYVDMGLDSVEILTGKKDVGLPIKMTFKVNKIDESKWNSPTFKLQIIDVDNKNKVIYNTQFNAGDVLGKTIEWTIPSTELGQVKDHKNRYQIKIVPDDGKKMSLISGSNTIDTHGFTATEETIKVSSAMSKTTFQLPAKTRKSVGDKNVDVFYEGYTVTPNKDVDTATGYGVGGLEDIQAYTELGQADLLKIGPDDTGYIIADNEVSDGNYPAYDAKHHKVDVTEKITSAATLKKESGKKDKWVETTSFSLPATRVKMDGTVYVSNEATSKTVADGGRKLYVPIWLDELGTYEYKYVSTAPTGRNQVKLEIVSKVNVKSYMFAHNDSETLEDDAILIQPTKEDRFE